MPETRIMKIFAPVLLATTCLLMSSGILKAEVAGNGNTVPVLGAALPENEDPQQNHTYKDYINKVLAYSDFVIRVQGDAGVYYNDNIYRVRSGETDDIVSYVMPRIRGKSQWERHELGFDLSTELGVFASESENNYTDFDARVFGRYDFSDTMSGDLWGRYRYEHSSVGEDPDQPDTTLKEPPTYDYFELGGALRGLLAPLYHWDLTLKSLFYDYDNTMRRDGARSVYDDKDRDEHSVLATLAYDIAPQSQVFVRGGGTLIRYDKRVDSTLLYDHDADGTLALLGYRRDTAAAFWSLAVGYQYQDYEAPEFKDVSMLAVQGEAELQLTPSTALSLDLNRTIRESSSTGVSSYIQSRGEATLEHTFNTDWSASAGARYTINDFQSNTTLSGTDRKDKIFEPELAAHYQINDLARVSFEYKYADRSSNNNAVEYDANVVGLRLSLRP
ncbi:MAG: outer membrane beta-barrel protein [Rhodospirillales bacterium]|nr:outer membrane beta-barrel protein [Rhodospirillales bacterium]